MKTAKIIGISIERKYGCPACGWEHWVCESQLENLRFIIVCPCGESLKLERPQYITDKLNKDKEDYGSNEPRKKLLDALKDLGFDTDDAKRRVTAVFNSKDSVSVLIKKALQV